MSTNNSDIPGEFLRARDNGSSFHGVLDTRALHDELQGTTLADWQAAAKIFNKKDAGADGFYIEETPISFIVHNSASAQASVQKRLEEISSPPTRAIEVGLSLLVGGVVFGVTENPAAALAASTIVSGGSACGMVEEARLDKEELRSAFPLQVPKSKFQQRLLNV